MNEKNISRKITDNTILICANNDWEGPAKDRLKQPGEENGIKGNYRICPKCNGKDFYTKPQEYQTMTFSVDPDMESTIKNYTIKYGLPKGYKSDD
ncbi:MAG: hypothetical protein WC812_00530 [Candidatus Pacearchaeota archaeon]|jgi:hypothetical protein